jgi:hypothetical protein
MTAIFPNGISSPLVISFLVYLKEYPAPIRRL